MRKFIQEDGTEVEVPDEAEIKALQEKASKVDELSKNVETLTKEKDALEADPSNRNWKQLRDVTDKLKNALKAQGKVVDEDGTVSEPSKVPTLEEISAKTRSIVREENFAEKKKNALSKFPDEKRKVVEHYLGKLTAGEEVNSDNFDKFVNDAILLADPQSAGRKPVYSGGGQPPLLRPQEGNSFTETDAGKSVAEEVFGDNSFTKAKK